MAATNNKLFILEYGKHVDIVCIHPLNSTARPWKFARPQKERSLSNRQSSGTSYYTPENKVGRLAFLLKGSLFKGTFLIFPVETYILAGKIAFFILLEHNNFETQNEGLFGSDFPFQTV